MENKVLPAQSIMYDALLTKDSSFEGIFWAAIKTTGIFCRPSCTARKPKEENVEYFASAKEAMDYGYRPCKVCKPLEMNGATPDWLADLFKKINQEPELRLKDYDLRQLGIDPSRIRRWFKKHHGMTFQAYLRMMRINKAFGQIKHGRKVTSSAFSHGYDSLSGFTDSFKKNTGFTPINSKHHQLISITRIPTPLGPMLVGATEDGICLLEFTDRRMLETQLKRLKSYLKAELLPGTSPHFELLEQQLTAYFKGELKVFDLPLVVPGTDFQKKVWGALQTIAYGSTRSYKEQALHIGNPKAVRAVAKANGDNRLAIIIPCHRVIGSDGKLTGYGGGLWRKQWMLNHEKKFAE